MNDKENKIMKDAEIHQVVNKLLVTRIEKHLETKFKIKIQHEPEYRLDQCSDINTVIKYLVEQLAEKMNQLGEVEL